MDLSKSKLPGSVELPGGNLYKIHTDYRFFITLARMLNNEKTLIAEVIDYIYIEKPADHIAGFNALMNFYRPSRELPRAQDETRAPVIAYDWDTDSDFIYSAFMQQYGIDLLDVKELHWHKFLALFHGLVDTKLNEIISYRLYEPGKNEPEEMKKHYNKLKSAWEILTPEQLAAEAEAAGQKDKALDRFEKWLAGEIK